MSPSPNSKKPSPTASADKKLPKPAIVAPDKPRPTQLDDDVVGKVYDGRLMRRLITYLSPYKLQVAVSLVCIFIKSASIAVVPSLRGMAVDLFMGPTAPGTTRPWLASFLSSDAMTGVTQVAMVYLFLLVSTFLLELLQTYTMQWTGQKIMFDLRKEIFRHIQLQDVVFFDRNPVGRLVTRVTSDVDAINEVFTSGVLDIFENVITLASIVGTMLWINWALALVTLSVIPLIIWVTNIFRKSVRVSYRSQRAATAKINSFTQEYVSGMSVVQLFNRERRAYDDFAAVNQENKTAWADAITAYALYYPIVEFLGTLAIALVLWQGGSALMRHFGVAVAHDAFSTVTVGTLVAFIGYAQNFFRPIQELSDKFNVLQAAMAASERVFKLLDQAPRIVSPDVPVLPAPRSPDYGRVEFRNVWFTYQQLTEEDQARVAEASDDTLRHDTAIEWILTGVSFVVEPNETAAIVGHTGAGKTTITALMMRFYDIQRGEILIDGVEVRRQDLNALRRRFGVVLQDPFLFSGTIGDNIRLGTQSITQERLERAADEVNVGDFIRTLPLGFAEPVRERGAGLSTGQKQLISFARALAHDPGILILDEATSSVDTETEHRVRVALTRMITGRTSVLIAHRLSTIQSADTILVMHKGQLREQGTHQELLAQHGLYYKLYQLQYQDQEQLSA